MRSATSGLQPGRGRRRQRRAAAHHAGAGNAAIDDRDGAADQGRVAPRRPDVEPSADGRQPAGDGAQTGAAPREGVAVVLHLDLEAQLAVVLAEPHVHRGVFAGVLCDAVERVHDAEVDRGLDLVGVAAEAVELAVHARRGVAGAGGGGGCEPRGGAAGGHEGWGVWEWWEAIASGETAASTAKTPTAGAASLPPAPATPEGGRRHYRYLVVAFEEWVPAALV